MAASAWARGVSGHDDPLGEVMRDCITGFEGVAISRTEHLDGTVFYELQPQMLHDCHTVRAESFDAARLAYAKPRPESEK